MAVSEQFKEQWLECQEEYGKNIDAGDIPVIPIDKMDMAVTLPAVRFTAPYSPTGENKFDSYGHVPMQTFKTWFDNLASDAESDHARAEQDHTTATDDHDTATDDHSTAQDDHDTATTDHSTATNAHGIATQDHTTATSDHSRAETDHASAEQDHLTASTDHGTAGTDHTRAEQDHSTAQTDHGMASQDHTTATQDHSASVTATTAATNVNADLAGMTVTITDRNGVSKSVNIGFEILQEHVYPSVAAMNADAANVRAGQFCMIAATDPTSTENAQLWSRNSSAATSKHPFTFLSDLDQASSAAFADWLDNYKPVIEADHTRAENDHSTASTDHGTATQDHTTATTDHGMAGNDHTRAEQDHSTAQADHSTAGNDHTRAEQDHLTATTDHGYATQDHTTATTDHGTAGNDHTQAEQDHTTAQDDHGIATSDHSTAQTDHDTVTNDHKTATDDHDAAVVATAHAEEEGDRAKGYNDHPWSIGNDGYIYVWDESTQAMKKTNKMIIDFSDLTEAQKQAMAEAFYSTIVYATVAESQAAARELT